MSAHEQTVLIDRPLAEVFAYMNDVSREHEWQPQLVEAEQTPSGPTRVGSRRRYVSEFLGKRLTNTYVVHVFEPGRRLVLESTPDSALRVITELCWEVEGTGTRVTMTVDGAASGPLRFVPKALIEATFEKEVRAALRRLKEVLEAR